MSSQRCETEDVAWSEVCSDEGRSGHRDADDEDSDNPNEKLQARKPLTASPEAWQLEVAAEKPETCTIKQFEKLSQLSARRDEADKPSRELSLFAASCVKASKRSHLFALCVAFK